MKKISLFLCLFIAFNVHAQIKKGSWMLGGSAGFGTTRIYGDIDEITDFEGKWLNFNPEIGYFMTNRLVVGAALQISASRYFTNRDSKTFGLSSEKSKRQSYEIAPFVRYYFYKKRAFNVYYQFDMSSELSKTQSTENIFGGVFNTDRTYTAFAVSNSFGVDYFITKNIALEADWNYRYYYEFKEKDNKQPVQKYALPQLAFTPEVRIKLFLNTDKSTPQILADKYLKKGNTTFGLEGALCSACESVEISPSMGYFLTNKWMIGSGLTAFYQKDNRFYVGISPEMRFYQPITKNMQLLLRGATWAGLSVLSDNKSTIFNSGAVNLEIGLNKFIAENISVYGLADMDLGLWKDKLNLRPRVRFGFQYFMNEKIKLRL